MFNVGRSSFFGARKQYPSSPITLTPTEDLLESNKEQLRVFGRTEEWATVKVLGVGAFGEVILTKNVESNKMVAKKVVPLGDSKTSYEYASEELIHVQLKHPNIVELFCWVMLEDKLQLVMEYCSRGDVQGNLDEIERKDALAYFNQMMEGVEYLHSRGVAHRDLKPGNLLLTQDGVLKIADFGLAAIFIVDGKEIELKGRCGTRVYMAPEVVIDQESSYLGPPIDLWSCGVILVKMLTKERPWNEALPQNRHYRMWLEKSRRLKKTSPWNLLDKSSRSIVDILLEPDPLLRLSRWKSHR
ncbi:serine/threonine-protein kinase Chk1-like [Oratosquilla oratoria]|uniref:serine/threonine-protein kinase Chk1-like n=1 Tax=Oratosquilla oratoria TaxID=337810 RepID=UPI003F75A9CD